jgi:hypothetical protein
MDIKKVGWRGCLYFYPRVGRPNEFCRYFRQIIRRTRSTNKTQANKPRNLSKMSVNSWRYLRIAPNVVRLATLFLTTLSLPLGQVIRRANGGVEKGEVH